MKSSEIINKRNSSIELLRIISMLMIIVSHYTVHGGFDFINMPFSFNKLLLHFTVLGNLGVNIFFLISGYFLSKSKFSIKKLLKLMFEVFSYSIIIFLIFILIGKQELSLMSLVRNLFPIIFEQYWFASAYVIMYLLFPFFNKLISVLDEKEHFKLISIMLLIFSFLYTFIDTNNFTNCLIDLTLMYFIAAFMNKYKDTIKKYNKHINILMVLSILTLIFITVAFSYFNIGANYVIHFYARYSIFIVLIAIGLFNLFLNKNFYNKLINNISTCTFGIYLIHDNNYIREFLWTKLFKNNLYASSNYLIVHMLLCVVIVFIVCIIIEYIRKISIQKLFDKVLDKLLPKVEKQITEIKIFVKKLLKL